MTYVSAMLEDPVLRPHAEVMLAQIRTLKRLGVDGAMQPAERAGLEQGVEDVGYWVVPADSRTTVIAFTGRAMRLDISIYFMQRLLSRFGVNVIYVFDWIDAYYFAGVKGLGEDTRSCAARLHEMCVELGTKRLICFGQSTGGYAAIRYGVKLGADGVLAFSPVILPVMQAPNLDRIEAALGRRPKRRQVDLRQVLMREPKSPYTKIVFGGGNEADVQSARHLAGLPRVVEHLLPGLTTHGTIEATTLSGEFPRIFATFCDEIGPGRWAGVNTRSKD